jgi:DNA-directed RNA polymerase specialized sigma24 family protein
MVVRSQGGLARVDSQRRRRGSVVAGARAGDRRGRRKRLKRGGDRRRVELVDRGLSYAEPVEEVIAIDEVLGQLAREDPQAAELIKFHVFAGLAIEDVAEIVGFSRSTAYEHWAYARAWLHRRLRVSLGGKRV